MLTRLFFVFLELLTHWEDCFLCLHHISSRMQLMHWMLVILAKQVFNLIHMVQTQHNHNIEHLRDNTAVVTEDGEVYEAVRFWHIIIKKTRAKAKLNDKFYYQLLWIVWVCTRSTRRLIDIITMHFEWRCDVYLQIQLACFVMIVLNLLRTDFYVYQ